MHVELERPFVWPEEPEDYSPWNKDESKLATEEQREFQMELAPDKDRRAVSDVRREKLREQAKALLEGREKWKPGAAMGGSMFSGRT